MASIQSSIELLDRVSDPMLAMLDAITRVTVAFEKLYERANYASSALDMVQPPHTAMQETASQAMTAASGMNAVSDAAQNAASAIRQTANSSTAFRGVSNQIQYTANSMHTISSDAGTVSAQVGKTAFEMHRASDAAQSTAGAVVQSNAAIKNITSLMTQAGMTAGTVIEQVSTKMAQSSGICQKAGMNNLSLLNKIVQQEKNIAVSWTNVSLAAQRSGKYIEKSSLCASKSTQTIGASAQKAAAAYQIIGNNISTSMQKASQKMREGTTATENMTRAQRRHADAEAKAAMKQEELNQKVRGTGNSTDNNTRKQQRFNNSIQTGVNQYNTLLSRVKSMAAAVVSIQGVKMTLGLSDELANTTARLNMLTENMQETQQIQSQVFAAANRARGSYQDMADLVGKLGILAGDAFSSTQETVAFAELLNKQFAISGTSVEGASAATLQLTQALGSGVLRGEELNSVFEQAPTIIQQIASYLGVSVGEIRNLAADGAISANIVKNALLSAANETNVKFESMPMTFSQVMTQMKNYALRAFQPVLERFTTMANSEEFQQMIQSVIQSFAILGNAALFVLDKMSSGAAYVRQNWETIAPILKIVAIAVGGVAAAYAIYTTAATVARIAQTLLNSAMLSSPIFWIIAAVMALVAAFVVFTEQMVGAMWVAGAFFKNVGLWCANLGIAIWKVIKNIGLWFGNLGIAIWKVIKNTGLWFANLGVTIWEVIKNIGLWFANLGIAIWEGVKNIGIWIANLGIGIWKVIQNIGTWAKNLGESTCAIIENIGLWFANLGIGIWNVLSSCAYNVGVAFNNAWYSVKAGFLSMVETILSKAGDLLGGINSLLPEEYQIGGDGLNNAIDNIRSSIDEANASMMEYRSLSAAWDEGFHTYEYKDVSDAFHTFDYDNVGDAFHTFDYANVGDAFHTFDYDSVGDTFHTFDYDNIGDAFHTFDYDNVGDAFHTFDVFQDGWLSDAYNAGAEKGAYLKEKTSDIWAKIKGLGNGLTDSGDTTLAIDPNDYLGIGIQNAADDVTDASDGLTDASGGLADAMNTLARSNDNLDDTVSMSNDMMQYMRDVAERDAINRFTTAEIHVDFQSNNTINSEMDIDGVVSALEYKVQQALTVAAEGVHC